MEQENLYEFPFSLFRISHKTCYDSWFNTTVIRLGDFISNFLWEIERSHIYGNLFEIFIKKGTTLM